MTQSFAAVLAFADRFSLQQSRFYEQLRIPSTYLQIRRSLHDENRHR
jgi:hypothetical protein